MKKILILGFSLGVALFVQNCRPKSDPNPTSSSISSSTSPQGKQTDDQSRVSDATGHGADEANNVVSNDGSLSGSRLDQTAELPCNITTSTISGNLNYRKIVFNGLSCDGQYNRSGTAEITFVPSTTSGKWKTQGSKLVIKYINLKITKVSDGQFVTLNGDQTVTNYSGGNWIDLILLGQTLVTKIKGSYTVTFSDGSVRTWNEAKSRTLQYISTTKTLKFGLNGDTTLASTGTELASDWGVNRNNDSFVTTILAPLAVQNCSGTTFKFVGGKAKHYIPQGNLTVLFSSNANGVDVSSCDATGYYMTWLGTGSVSGGSLYSAY